MKIGPQYLRPLLMRASTGLEYAQCQPFPLEEDLPQIFIGSFISFNVRSEIPNFKGVGYLYISRKLYFLSIISHLLYHLV